MRTFLIAGACLAALGACPAQARDHDEGKAAAFAQPDAKADANAKAAEEAKIRGEKEAKAALEDFPAAGVERSWPGPDGPVTKVKTPEPLKI